MANFSSPSGQFHRAYATGRLASQTFNSDSGIITCTQCGPGLILPLFPFEMCWNPSFRATMYFIGLIYFFLGVAIVSDIFMASIEKITSKTRRAFVKFEYEGKVQYKVYDDKVWNDTIANLTLMALGSSAPEILLSCIEIVGHNFESGKLGAGTIVGSAAFNLLVIIAVCMISVPKGEVRKISTIKVFIVTTLFSLFAYLWMIICLDMISSGIIEVWEAILTLLMFPLLVLVSWWADHDFCLTGKRPKRWSSLVEEQEVELKEDLPFGEDNALYKDGIVNKEALMELYSRWRTINPDLTEEETAGLVARKLINDKWHSHLWYRSGVSRMLMGGPLLTPVLNEKLKEVYDVLNVPPTQDVEIVVRKDSDMKRAIIEFQAASAAVMENIGEYRVKLIRHGRTDNEVSVKLETFDGTANAYSDYIPFNYIVTFAPQCKEIEIPVTIVDDNQWEPEEEFFIRASVQPDGDAVMGKIPIMEIIILDDDNPGSVSFTQKTKMVKQDCGSVELQLKRYSGCDGIVDVSYKTIDGTAICPDDYTETQGKVVFKHAEREKTITIPIIAKENDAKAIYFFVVLDHPGGGVKIGDQSRTKITISNDEAFQVDVLDALDKVMQLAAENVETIQLGHVDYSSQFNDALSVNGGNIEEATRMDYILHVITFPWKVLFACIPPVGYCQGWLCFLASLLVIGILTAVIGDMAEMFGCLVGLKDTVTAITFVALGTSVPDLFASKAAVATEKHADNAIGNVTGSNSVNVFLGLGLPWTLAAIYHQINGTTFKVKSGDLAFSVIIYSATAVVAVFILFLRRIVWNAELGGGTLGKWTGGIILLLLWFVYIALSALRSYEKLIFF